MTVPLYDDDFGGVPTSGKMRNVEEILARTGGESIIILLRRLGFWVGADNKVGSVVSFPRKFSNLTETGDNSIGDLLAYWTSEYGRVSEMLGALSSERIRLKTALSQARSYATRKIHQQAKAAEEKAPGVRLLEALIAEDDAVQDVTARLSLIEQTIGSLNEIRNAIGAYREAVSREITRRGDLIRGRISSI